MGFDKSKRTIVFLISVLVVLLVGAIYILLINNPRFKVKLVMGNICKNAEAIITSFKKVPILNLVTQNDVEYTSRVVAKVSINKNKLKEYADISHLELEKYINNSTINTKTNFDIQDMYVKTSIEHQFENKCLSIDGYLNENDTYIQLEKYLMDILKIKNDKKSLLNLTESKDSFESKIGLDKLDRRTFFKMFKTDDVNYILKIIKYSLVNAVKFTEVTSTKDEIIIDKERIMVNKLTLDINDEYIKRVKTIFCNKISHNDKALKVLCKLGDYENVEEVESILRGEIINLEMEIKENKKLGEFTLYTKGIFNELVEIKIKDLEKDIQLQYTIDKNKKNKYIVIKNDNKIEYSLKITENEKYAVDYIKGEDYNLNLMGKISKDSIDVDYIFRINGESELKGDLKFDIKQNKNEYDQTLVIRLDTPESYGTGQLSIDSKLTKIAVINKKDLTEYIEVSSFKDEKIKELLSKIDKEHPMTIKVFESFNKELFKDMYIY